MTCKLLFFQFLSEREAKPALQDRKTCRNSPFGPCPVWVPQTHIFGLWTPQIAIFHSYLHCFPSYLLRLLVRHILLWFLANAFEDNLCWIMFVSCFYLKLIHIKTYIWFINLHLFLVTDQWRSHLNLNCLCLYTGSCHMIACTLNWLVAVQDADINKLWWEIVSTTRLMGL